MYSQQTIRNDWGEASITLANLCGPAIAYRQRWATPRSNYARCRTGDPTRGSIARRIDEASIINYRRSRHGGGISQLSPLFGAGSAGENEGAQQFRAK